MNSNNDSGLAAAFFVFMMWGVIIIATSAASPLIALPTYGLSFWFLNKIADPRHLQLKHSFADTAVDSVIKLCTFTAFVAATPVMRAKQPATPISLHPTLLVIVLGSWLCIVLAVTGSNVVKRRKLMTFTVPGKAETGDLSLAENLSGDLQLADRQGELELI